MNSTDMCRRQRATRSLPMDKLIFHPQTNIAPVVFILQQACTIRTARRTAARMMDGSWWQGSDIRKARAHCVSALFLGL